MTLRNDCINIKEKKIYRICKIQQKNILKRFNMKHTNKLDATR